MSVVINRSAEMDQVSRSHAVLILVHLDAQPELDLVSNVELYCWLYYATIISTRVVPYSNEALVIYWNASRRQMSFIVRTSKHAHSHLSMIIVVSQLLLKWFVHNCLMSMSIKYLYSANNRRSNLRHIKGPSRHQTNGITAMKTWLRVTINYQK